MWTLDEIRLLHRLSFHSDLGGDCLIGDVAGIRQRLTDADRAALATHMPSFESYLRAERGSLPGTPVLREIACLYAAGALMSPREPMRVLEVMGENAAEKWRQAARLSGTFGDGHVRAGVGG